MGKIHYSKRMGLDPLLDLAYEILKHPKNYSKREIENAANDLMEKGFANDPVPVSGFVFRAAELYRLVGKEKKVIPKLLKAIKEDTHEYEGVKKRKLKEFMGITYGLEGKVAIFLGLLAGGFGLSLISLNMTGGVIGGLTQPRELISLGLCIAGIIGAVFYFKRR